MNNVYVPKEDTFLFLDYLDKTKLVDKKIMDMGTGSGILSEKSLEKNAEHVLAVDINKEAIKKAKNRIKNNNNFEAIKSDLFTKVNKRDFDIILFNPPYLPTKNKEKESKIEKTYSGGSNGLEVIKKFLNEAKNYLGENGKIIILLSSKTNNKAFKEKCSELNYEYKKVSEKQLFYEKLYLYQLNSK